MTEVAAVSGAHPNHGHAEAGITKLDYQLDDYPGRA